MNDTPSTNPAPRNHQEDFNDLKEKVSRQRNLIPLSFALVVVFFFFGFCNFKCNGTKVAALKGINLVTGTHLKTSMHSAFNALDAFGEGRGRSARGEKIPPSLWAIVALASAITGFVIFYRGKKKEAFWGTIFGTAGFISLLILRLLIKRAVESKSGGMVQVDTSFLFGYWASVLAFIVAGGISYLRLRAEKAPPEPIGSEPKASAPTPVHIHVTTRQEDSERE